MLDANATDEALVRLWQDRNGSEEVFTVLERRYADQLTGFFVHMGFDRELARDLAQETFLSAFRGLDDFRLQSSFRTWLYQIARRVALKNLRRGKARKRDGEEVSLDVLDGKGENPGTSGEAASPLTVLIAKEERDRVREVVSALPPAERRTLLMRHWHGLSVQEVAAVLHKPEGTVKSTHWRALRKLEEQLKATIPDLPRTEDAP